MSERMWLSEELEKARTERDGLRAENARLREALEPFAALGRFFNEVAPELSDAECAPVAVANMTFGNRIRLGDIRRAVVALSGETRAEDNARQEHEGPKANLFRPWEAPK